MSPLAIEYIALNCMVYQVLSIYFNINISEDIPLETSLAFNKHCLAFFKRLFSANVYDRTKMFPGWMSDGVGYVKNSLYLYVLFAFKAIIQ